MILDVIKAEHISNYKLKIYFSNGEKKIVDLEETIFNDKREIFRPLRDIEYFKKFEIILNTIGWQNGLDLAPEYLYAIEYSTKLKNA